MMCAVRGEVEALMGRRQYALAEAQLVQAMKAPHQFAIDVETLGLCLVVVGDGEVLPSADFHSRAIQDLPAAPVTPQNV